MDGGGRSVVFRRAVGLATTGETLVKKALRLTLGNGGNRGGSR